MSQSNSPALSNLQNDPDRALLLLKSVFSFAIFSTDLQGVVQTWNPGATRFLGFTPDDILGRKADFIFTPEDRRAAVPELEMATCLERGEATDIRWHLHRDGSRIWANGMMCLLRDPNGLPRGFVKVLRDETARKLAEDALAKAKEAAEAATRAKDDFLAAVSHELGNPLSAILLWSKMLAADPTRLQLDEGLAIIQSSAESQRALIADLLDTARITRGQLRLSLKQLSLTDSIEEAVKAIRQTAGAKGVALKFVRPRQPITLRADADRLRQIFWNLLTNAVRSTPRGGSVRISCQSTAHDVIIHIADTGVGIAPDFLPRLFHPFVQAPATTAKPTAATTGRPTSLRAKHAKASAHPAPPSPPTPPTGLGLGLAITRRLLELHGGSISAQSKGLSHGATFSLTLPRTAPKKRFVNTEPRNPGPANTGRVSPARSVPDRGLPSQVTPVRPIPT